MIWFYIGSKRTVVRFSSILCSSVQKGMLSVDCLSLLFVLRVPSLSFISPPSIFMKVQLFIMVSRYT